MPRSARTARLCDLEVDGVTHQMPTVDVLPFLAGLSGTLAGSVELGVLRDDRTGVFEVAVMPPFGDDREQWRIEYQGDAFRLPGSWVIPFCTGLALHHGADVDSLGLHLANPGRQRRAQALAACDQRKWLRFLGLETS